MININFAERNSSEAAIGKDGAEDIIFFRVPRSSLKVDGNEN
jgi:hypothetical protein